MDKWCEIRQRVLRDGDSIRQIQRETGLHFGTVKKILEHSAPPEFQCPERPRPKIGPYLDRITAILEEDGYSDGKRPGIPRDCAHPFRCKAPTRTEGLRPGIPRDCAHRFRRKAPKHSEGLRPLEEDAVGGA